MKDDTGDILTSSVKKEPESEIPLLGFHDLPNVVSSNPVERQDSSTKGLPESSGKVEGHNSSAKGLPKSSGKVCEPSLKSQKLGTVNQGRISVRNAQMLQQSPPGAFNEEDTLWSKSAKKHLGRIRKPTSSKLGATAADVPVMREDAAYNTTHATSRNTRKRQRKKTPLQNRQNVTIPECAQDSQESVNANSDRVDFSCVRETVKIEDEECWPEVTWVSKGIVCNRTDSDIYYCVTNNRDFPDNEEKEDSATLNFIPDAQNTERKNTDASLDKPKGQRRRKAKKKSRSQKSVIKKKQTDSDPTMCVENVAKHEPDKLIKSKFHRKPDKIEPDYTIGMKNAPKQRPKKEARLTSNSRSNIKCMKVASEKSYRVEVPNELAANPIIEEKPKRKLRPKVYHCEHCPSTFSRMDYLKLHIMHHTNQRPFKCDICEKGFRMRWRVKLHRATHFDEKPHRCKFCSYRSIRRDALLSHMKRLHKNVVVCDKKDCLLDHFH